MSPVDDALRLELEVHRTYLRILAREQLNRQLWPQIDPSDVVQKTLLQAHEKREQFQGPCLKAWLRGILWHRLQDAVREAKRRSLEKHEQHALDQSDCGIMAALAAEQSSPSGQAVRHEQLQRLADALGRLPEGEREAVELHHLHDWPLAEIADHLKRTQPAVAGLLHRGLKRLRSIMQEGE
jgi:RNA polymerase sigma-70 factor (ECF subfamily)